MDDERRILALSSLYIYAIFGFLGFIVNSIQIVLMFCKREKKTVFDITLISLALSNATSTICFGALGTLFTYFIATLNFAEENFQTLNNMVYVSDYCVIISLLHITFIAIQRLFAVTLPFRFKAIFTKLVTTVLLMMIWLVSGMMMLLEYFVIKYAQRKIALACLIFTCGSSLAFIYSFVLYKVLKQRRAMQNVTSHAANTDHSCKLLLNSIGVTVVFILLTFPYAASVLENDILFIYGDFFASFLAIKTSFDPTIYFFVNRCKCSFVAVTRNVEPIDSGRLARIDNRNDHTTAL